MPKSPFVLEAGWFIPPPGWAAVAVSPGQWHMEAQLSVLSLPGAVSEMLEAAPSATPHNVAGSPAGQLVTGAEMNFLFASSLSMP